MKYIIVGAGGMGREIYSYFLDQPDSQVVGFLSDDPNALAGYNLPCKIIGDIDSHRVLDGCYYLLAIADPPTRLSVVDRLGPQATMASLVHPSAYIAPTAKLGEGVVIAPYCFVGPDAVVGMHVFLNVRSTVGHDASVGDYVTISPHAVVGGAASVGDGCFLATGTIVNPGRQLGDSSRVSSGAVVDRNIVAGSLVAAERAKSRVMFKVSNLNSSESNKSRQRRVPIHPNLK